MRNEAPYKTGLGSSLPPLSLTVELCWLETLLAAAASLNFALSGLLLLPLLLLLLLARSTLCNATITQQTTSNKIRRLYRPTDIEREIEGNTGCGEQ